MLRSMSGLTGGTATYLYGADGTRRQKPHNGTTTTFYYMGGLGYLDQGDTAFAADQEIAEYSGSTLLRRFVRLPGSVDEAFLMIDESGGSPVETWAHTDRLGSVVATTNGSGTVQDKYRYSPYGQPGAEGPTGFPFRFTGQRLDAETGLYYYKARYYDPETGRFLQTDPIGYEDQMNLYAYVHNDPVNAIDPSGEASYLVSRPIAGRTNHMFVLVVDDETGETRRFSYGPQRASILNPGQLVSVTGSKNDTDIADFDAAESFLSDPEAAEKQGIVATKLDASDKAVIRSGEAVDGVLGTPSDPGPIEYDNVGTRHGSDKANSNAAAYAVARRALVSEGELPKSAQTVIPGQNRTPGWDHHQNIPSCEEWVCE